MKCVVISDCSEHAHAGIGTRIRVRVRWFTLHVRVEIKRNVRACTGLGSTGHARALVSLARAREKLML